MKVACDHCETVTSHPVDWIKTEPYGTITAGQTQSYDAWFCQPCCLIAYFEKIAARRESIGL